ncbi:MAG TPA: tRNA (adenosine(37)-N6)-threonylcarbamoyltransferase complex transferase subunit TsaD [Ktedonobacterales bacterium]|nr:tRNA (adenosine(37)-N6)-threonylcarbamoyltransferase complex transferase subunit TsaD [Ktedonobacterales bacterium]
MLVLGIESSCDETGAALVADGRFIRANVVASQVDVHARYGGVVPEVASRHQLTAIIPVLEAALAQAGADWSDVDAIAATYGPGLAGSLLVGLTAAKTLAWARRLPFIGINHLEAHIYANWLRDEPAESTMPAGVALALPGDPGFPLLALVVSGAHTELVHIPGHGRYELLGKTRDDAAGEAFDKVGRLLGLGYPGGPAIQRAAASRPAGAPNPVRLPRARLRGAYDFSFSGLKTATLQLVERLAAAGDAALPPATVAEIADAFQDAVVDVLVTKTTRAAESLGVAQVLLAGGVAANAVLRTRLEDKLAPQGIALSAPPVALCTDNAAMIAGAGYFHAALGERSGFELDVAPGLRLPFAGGTSVAS